MLVVDVNAKDAYYSNSVSRLRRVRHNLDVNKVVVNIVSYSIVCYSIVSQY